MLSSDGGSHSESLRASAEWRSRNFALPDQVFYVEPTRFRASAGLVITFGAKGFVAADAHYEEQYRLPPALRGEKRYGTRLIAGLDLTDRIARPRKRASTA